MKEQRMRFIVLAALLVVLQTADGFLTTYLLNNNFGYEGMPIVSSVAGYWWFGLAKLIITAGVLFILWKRLGDKERNYKFANKGLLVLVILFSLIVGWNLFVFNFGVGNTAEFMGGL